MLATLIIQFRLRKYETRETFFIVRNLVIAILLIQLTFLFGTTFHMDLFWIRVAQLSPSLETPTFYRVKHILCLSVPIFLHFIHLASLFWMLSHTILLYQRFWRPIILPEGATTGDEGTEDTATLKGTVKCKPIKCHDFLAENANQLSSSSKECRKRYLKQVKFKSTVSRTKQTISKYALIRCLTALSTLLLFPLKGISNSIKSFSIVKHLNKKQKKANSLNGTQGGMQMEPIVCPSSTLNGAHSIGNLQLHHLLSEQCLNSSGAEVNGRKIDMQSMPIAVPVNEPQPSRSTEKTNNRRASEGTHTASWVRLPLSTCFSRTWKCQHYLGLSMGLPFILVLLSYLLNSKGYETRR